MITRQKLSHSDWFRGTNQISLGIVYYVELGMSFLVVQLLSGVILLHGRFNEQVVLVDQFELLVNALSQNLSDLR